jgi:hypothetical protein
MVWIWRSPKPGSRFLSRHWRTPSRCSFFHVGDISRNQSSAKLLKVGVLRSGATATAIAWPMGEEAVPAVGESSSVFPVNWSARGLFGKWTA